MAGRVAVSACASRWFTATKGSPCASAMPLPKEAPTTSPPISPGPAVAATPARSAAREAGFAQHPLRQARQVLQVGAGGDLRHHAAEGRVRAFLAEHGFGEDGAVGGADHRGGGLVAARFEAQHRAAFAAPPDPRPRLPCFRHSSYVIRACRPPRSNHRKNRPPPPFPPATAMAAAARCRLRVGTRASPLALWQTRHFLSIITRFCPVLREAGAFEEHPIRTTGDQRAGPAPGGDRRQGPVRQGDPRGAAGPPGGFRGAQPEGPRNPASRRDRPGLHPEAGGRAGRADPAARARRVADPADPWGALPAGAVVGTASVRRQAQLLAARPDLCVATIRGNVQTRLARVAGGEVAASLLALAGLRRLGLEAEAAAVLDPEAMVPAAGPGHRRRHRARGRRGAARAARRHRGPRGGRGLGRGTGAARRRWTVPAARRSAGMRGCWRRRAACTSPGWWRARTVRFS